MNVRDLVPFWKNDTPPAVAAGGGDVQPLSSGEHNPFLSLHREMNRLFDDTFRSSIVPRTPIGLSEVSETADAYTLTAELPGMSEQDVEIYVQNGTLVLKGEKRSETKDEEKRFTERSYGRFERRLALGPDVDADAISADFSNGVLTVRLPKTEAAKEDLKRIAINGGATSDDQVH